MAELRRGACDNFSMQPIRLTLCSLHFAGIGDADCRLSAGLAGCLAGGLG